MAKAQTTLRVSEKLHARFKELADAQNQSMSDVLEKLLMTWVGEHSAGPKSEHVTMDHAVSLLMHAVCEQLSQHPEWAMEALVEAGMGLPGGNVFSKRITHFSYEKQELAKRFSNWLVRRSISFIEKGRKVVLLCDSGTTVFWFMKLLGEAIRGFLASGDKTLKREDLVVVTNNIPGAESFVTYAARHSVSLKSVEIRLSDLVECRMLAGTYLPEYAAITGRDTEKDLENYVAQARPETRGKQARNSGPVFIAITTGNWIAIQDSEGIARPTLLARGRGHGAFKKELMKLSDEIFVIGPLGKILLDTSVADLNKRLKFSTDATNPQEQSYEEISLPSKAQQTKVVTTYREKESILRDHSAFLCKKLGSFNVLDEANQTTVQQASNPVGRVGHLLFPFDKFHDQKFEIQKQIELPHEKTQEESFMREVFSIRT